MASGGSALLNDLLDRCQSLLDQLQNFNSFLNRAKEEAPYSKFGHAVDTKQFFGMVVAEKRSLEKLSAADPDAEKTMHMLKSSNLPFYSAIWETAKTCKSLVTFHKRFYWEEMPTRRTKRSLQKRAALVDIVAEDGDEWIRVSTITEERLLRELAKARWEMGESSDEDETDGEGDSNGAPDSTTTKEDEYDRIDLVKVAVDLQRAAHANRIHYHYPRLRLVLSNMHSPCSDELRPFLDRIASKNIEVDFALTDERVIPQDLESIFPKLLPSPHPNLTKILNIDCTILLALVSDLSYTSNHPVQPSYNAAIRRQIELETQDHLLPLSLWPALADKDLVCTGEAVKRMREIVNTIGTPSERARTELIMEDGDPQEVQEIEATNQGFPPDDRRAGLQRFSDYPVPASFKIPILTKEAPTTVDLPDLILQGKLPAVAQQIADDMTDINRSVFIYGWLNGYTTVSSNRTIIKSIERTIEKHARGDKGPEVWLREPARSLVGKEKVRRK